MGTRARSRRQDVLKLSWPPPFHVFTVAQEQPRLDSPLPLSLQVIT